MDGSRLKYLDMRLKGYSIFEVIISTIIILAIFILFLVSLKNVFVSKPSVFDIKLLYLTEKFYEEDSRESVKQLSKYIPGAEYKILEELLSDSDHSVYQEKIIIINQSHSLEYNFYRCYPDQPGNLFYHK